MSEQTTNHEFRAETRKVLNILTHSLYSNREIFLRELISNASDALDKLRFLQSQTQHEAIRDAELPAPKIRFFDKCELPDHHRTGIGMTRDEMIENLGTIAHSGFGSLPQGTHPDRRRRHDQRRFQHHRTLRHRLLFRVHGRGQG